jgi:hypothetical protein
MQVLRHFTSFNYQVRRVHEYVYLCTSTQHKQIDDLRIGVHAVRELCLVGYSSLWTC